MVLGGVNAGGAGQHLGQQEVAGVGGWRVVGG